MENPLEKKGFYIWCVGGWEASGTSWTVPGTLESSLRLTASLEGNGTHVGYSHMMSYELPRKARKRASLLDPLQ